MPIITRLQPAPRRPGYFEVEVDHESLGVVSEKDMVRLGLSEQVELDDAQTAELRMLAGLAEALRLLNRFLAHRPRTTEEVRQRLRRTGLGDEVIAAAIEALRTQGLLDDKRFADLWVESRKTFSPRSPRLLQAELRRKGVDRTTIDETLGSISDEDETNLAIEAGRQRLRRYSTEDKVGFERSMGAYLGRRGFGYSAVRAALESLWTELEIGD
jgi:regulatory protein